MITQLNIVDGHSNYKHQAIIFVQIDIPSNKHDESEL